MTNQPVVSPAKVIGGGYNKFWHNKNFYRVVKGSRGSKRVRQQQLISFTE